MDTSDTSMGQRIQILDSLTASFLIDKIALEVEEDLYPETELVIIGVDSRGMFLAEAIQHRLMAGNNIRCRVYKAGTERVGYTSAETYLPETTEIQPGQSVLVVDDVLYSGRTLFLTIHQVLKYQPGKVRVAVLIDRGHRKLPLDADFVGKRLGTTLQEHIAVEIQDGQVEAYIFS
jgi:pyrimidine operon attenuation protein/uracil phosphoribosyltransferase